MSSDLAILAEGLTKRFGDTLALDGLDLAVPKGTVLALLGHNGAGKTTAVRILTTLLRADGGHGEVNGRDVAADPHGARAQFALAGQQASVDELLTGRENLVLLARLQRVAKKPAHARATELLERFGLAGADRPLKTYSGGMRRRLDLAACLLVPRPVVFLDEPTAGLDPVAREDVLGAIRTLADEGVALLLTTQYLEEADRLADRITVLADGREQASGTAAELKARVGGRRVEITLADPADMDAATTLLQADADPRRATLSRPAARGAADLQEALDALAAADIAVEEAGLRRPTLDDAFFALAGATA